MQVPLELTFRGLRRDPPTEAYIREKAAKLERVSGELVSCRVAVEKPQEHARSGNPYRVRVEVTLPPNHDLIVVKDPRDNDLHDGLKTVIRRAFDAAERRVKDAVDRKRHEVKVHREPHGFVTRIFREEGYGFFFTDEHGEVYFHRNSVLHDDFDRLERGTEVRYAAEVGDDGVQASTVQVVSKPGVRAGAAR